MNQIPNISYTTKHDLCTGCGICVDACPMHAISMKTDRARFVPQVDDCRCNNSKGCHRCYDMCPGLGVKLQDMALNLFYGNDVKENPLVGKYFKCYTGYSKNSKLRLLAASGGLLSQFIIWLLDKRIIDGAVVTRFNKEKELKVEPFIATKKEDILSAKGSKYAPVNLSGMATGIKNAEGSRYIVVGLPCHIHGIRKLMAMDKILKKKICGVFSLFCSGTQTFNYTEYILGQSGVNLSSVDYLAYREGNPTSMIAKGEGFEIRKDYNTYNTPLKATFYPRRCLLCVDMFGELADLNFGDIFMEENQDAGNGINALIARDSRWNSILLEAYKDNAIDLKEITIDRLLQKRQMAYIKKNRNAAFIAVLKKFSVVTPDYGTSYKGKVKASALLRYFLIRLKQFAGTHKSLWFLLPQIK